MTILEEIEKAIKTQIPTSGPKSFKLLFRARNDNDLKEFHAKCDAQGPTVTLLYGRHNVFFGGYTSKDWSSANNKMVEDGTAFLFYKNDNDQAEFNIFPISPGYEKRAITCNPNFGPTFGGSPFYSYDLQTFSLGGNKKSEMKDTFLLLNGDHNYNCVYMCKSNHLHKKEYINGGTMEVKMLEVYQVQDDFLKTPWRTKPDSRKLEEMFNHLTSFEPLSFLEIPCFNILLVGVIGSGKSSFYNTLATVFANAVKDTAPSGEETTSITNKICEYGLTSKENEKPLKLKIFDIRGFEIERSYEHELEHLLNGKLPKNYQFPDKPVPLTQENLVDQFFRNEMHLVCFVTDANKLELQKDSERMINAFKAVSNTVRRKGIPLVAVATKIDLLCPRIRTNVDNVYTSPKALASVMAVANILGLQQKQVFPVINYVNDNEVCEEKNILAIEALHSMVTLMQGHFENTDMVQKTDKWKLRLTKLSGQGGHDGILNRVLHDLNLLDENRKELKVVCVGPVRSGKSSFIDSILSSLTGRMQSKAVGGLARRADSDTDASASEKFNLYALKYKGPDDSLLPAHVTIGDMPGFQAKGGLELEHVKMVINGHVPNKFKIINGINEESKKYKKNPGLGDKIHCVCFVFDITTVDSLSEKAKTACKNLIEWLNEKDIPYMVVLTKPDMLNKAVEWCTLELFENEIMKEKINTLIDMFAFREHKIFPIRNYVHESFVVRDMDMLLLSAFREFLLLASEYIDEAEKSSSSEEEDGSDSVKES